MRCPHCGADVVEGAAFCQACGEALAGSVATPPNSDSTPGKKTFKAALAGRGHDDDPDDTLWAGTFSKRAMVGSWAAAAAATLLVVLVGLVTGFDGRTWSWALTAVAVAWILLFLRLIYMQLSVHYTLTAQRFVHERGLLWRQQDRIETIDIDDVTVQQGPVQRMLGVGAVRITSSDRSTPEFVLSGIEDVRSVAALIDDTRRKERRRRGVHIEAV